MQCSRSLLARAALSARSLGGCEQNLTVQKAKTEKLISTQLAVVGQPAAAKPWGPQ
jgi:hypothetical protein